jgi:18S rRNA (adenine1779-N6/adenine1780-N6)-dimethyltransferase
MYQKEFADRLTARAGDNLWCRLSANTQLLSRIEHVVKVGKNNFRPPPKVDSAVVKIIPKYPPPPIDFLEWDGLTRICFLRKNKTLGALFKNKHVISMVTKNYQTYCSLKNKPVDPTFDAKEVILKILAEDDMGDKRAAKLDLDDILSYVVTIIVNVVVVVEEGMRLELRVAVRYRCDCFLDANCVLTL